MAVIDLTLNDDGTLSLPAQTLTAQQLDELLQALAKARSQMIPAVPDAFVPTMDSSPITQPSPAARMFRTGGGEVTLCLRHRGFGWLLFLFEPSEAMEFAAWFRDGAGAGDFVRKEVGSGGLH